MILITGANGLVGTSLVKELVKRKYKIKCFIYKYDKKNLDLLKKLGVEIIYGDITEKESILNALKNVKQVIHLAALVGSGNKALNYKINFLGTKNLIEACEEKGIKRVIWTSSIAAIFKKPIEYSKAKIKTEELFRKSKLDYTILRPTLIYGKGGLEFGKIVEIINKFPIIPVIGSGKAKKQPVYVGDVVKAIIAVLNSKKTISKIYTIGGEEVLSFNQLIDVIASELNLKKKKIHLPIWICIILAKIFETIPAKEPPLIKDSVIASSQDAIGDITLAKKELNYKPIPLREGLKKVL